MKTLVLCRHAKSSWKYDTKDLYRPLNKRGIAEAPIMARQWQGKTPSLVLSSPAVRTYATAMAYLQEKQWPLSCLTLESALLDADADTIINILKVTDNQHDVVWLFGHNPGLNSTVELLTRQKVENIVTSARVHLSVNIHHWGELTPHFAPGLARIEQIFTPKRL